MLKSVTDLLGLALINKDVSVGGGTYLLPKAGGAMPMKIGQFIIT